jgi:hypothetical protein
LLGRDEVTRTNRGKAAEHHDIEVYLQFQ